MNVSSIQKMNKLLFFLTIVLFSIGLIMIQSASSFESFRSEGYSPYYYFLKQSVILIASFVGYMIIIHIPISFYEKYIHIVMLLIIVVLFGVLAYGEVSNNAKSWIKLFGGFTIQPSEFAKIILILYFASYFKLFKERINELKNIVRPLFLSMMVIVAVLMQPDLGTAIIVMAIVGTQTLLSPLTKQNKIKLIVGILITMIVVGGVGYLVGFNYLTAGQVARFNYFQPCSRYQEDSGYQVCNGFIAMNNGGLFGRGVGNSIQKFLYLPFGYTDFIFAIIIEELGLLISMFIILMMLVLIYLIYKISKMTEDICGRMICYGVCVYILSHLFVNLFGITGMIPLTGVPLPFLSYGGSFTLSLTISLALVQRVYIESIKIKKIKKVKK